MGRSSTKGPVNTHHTLNVSHCQCCNLTMFASCVFGGPTKKRFKRDSKGDIGRGVMAADRKPTAGYTPGHFGVLGGRLRPFQQVPEVLSTQTDTSPGKPSTQQEQGRNSPPWSTC